MRFIFLSLIYFLVSVEAASNKCRSNAECALVWPDAVCSRSRCRCPANTVRKTSSTREFVCLSLVDITTGEAGPPLTCPLPEGAGYQVVLRNNSNPVFCSSKGLDCPADYECIQGLELGGYYEKDGVCCPTRETTCAHPIFDHDDGSLQRWGFDGQDCVQFQWNPNRPSTANVFKTREHCLSYCVKNYRYIRNVASSFGKHEIIFVLIDCYKCLTDQPMLLVISHHNLSDVLESLFFHHFETIFADCFQKTGFFKDRNGGFGTRLRIAMFSIKCGTRVISRLQVIHSCSTSTFNGIIPVDAVEKRFSLSSGPGGQNVQKNHTKAEIRFNIDRADWLPQELKQPLKDRLSNRINQHGELIIDSDRTRERNMNLADCFDKLRATIYDVQRNQNLRQETEEDKIILERKAEKAAQNRLIEKRRQAMKKASRSVTEY